MWRNTYISFINFEFIITGPIIKKQKMNDCPFRVAIELGYQHLMTDLVCSK